jgi:hypothetical protein
MTAIIAITTSNSIKVNTVKRLLGRCMEWQLRAKLTPFSPTRGCDGNEK